MTSSPSFESFVEPQQGQLCGAAITTRSRGKCSGNGLRAGRLRSKHLTTVEVAVRSAASSLLDRVGLDVLQLHLQLIEKPLLTFRAHAIKRAPQLFDLKPQPCDQRLGAGRCCLSVCQIGFSARCPRLAFHPRRALGED